jgi:IS5 family transposase
MTEGQVGDHTRAAALPGALPAAGRTIADRAKDADWFRQTLEDKRRRPRIPGRKSRGKAIRHDKRRSARRDRIGIIFGRRTDWRRIATRHDRGARTCLSATALAAAVMFRP